MKSKHRYTMSRAQISSKSKKLLLLFIILLLCGSALVWALYFTQKEIPSIIAPSPHVREQGGSDLFIGLYRIQPGEAKQEYVMALLNVCNRQNGRSLNYVRCLKSMGKLLVEEFQFKEIVTALENSGKDCHVAMHYSVNAAYASGASISDIWTQCTNACFGACYHGGLEGILASKGLIGADEQIIKTALLDICEPVLSSFKTKKSQCFHGLGHAIMLLTKGELPKSLVYCDTLVEGGRSCYEGVFMENSPNTSTQEHPPKYINENDPQYPCNILAEKYKQTCYAFQTSYYSYISNGDVSKVVKLCQDNPAIYQSQCFHAIGTGAPGSSKTLQGYYDVCKKVTTGLTRKTCVIGVVDSYKDRYPRDLVKLAQASQFCSLVESGYKDSCYRQIGMIATEYGATPKDKLLVCKDIKEISYKSLCLN